jgi:glyoxylate/hydroxypyruvate reductase A
MQPEKSVIIDLRFPAEEIENALASSFPGRNIINLGDETTRGLDLSRIDYAVVWKPQADLFSRATGLKVVFSGGAGVDHILTLPGLPDLPLVRFVDRSLTTRMSEWVVMQCLMHLRQTVAYDENRASKIWKELSQPEARDVTVGIMGLGVLGQDAAEKLRHIGFHVIGWSRTPKHIAGVQTFSAGDLDVFLGQTDILVGLLPLTAETTGLFNMALFQKLRQTGALGEPVFINAGRGKSQVEKDVIIALEQGILKGVSLDVFETEPLPADSPLWSMKNVLMTPHAAAASDCKALFQHVQNQIDRFEKGFPLEHVVNRGFGY